VTKGMDIYFLATCPLLGISRCLGQAVKKEAATKVLVTVSETKYIGSKFYWYFSNNLIVPVQPPSAREWGIVKSLNGHIISL